VMCSGTSPRPLLEDGSVRTGVDAVLELDGSRLAREPCNGTALQYHRQISITTRAANQRRGSAFRRYLRCRWRAGVCPIGLQVILLDDAPYSNAC
jgi:hypothetical protein